MIIILEISYDVAYVQNLKKIYKWIYLWNRGQLTDIENKLRLQGGKGDGKGELGSLGWTCTLCYI